MASLSLTRLQSFGYYEKGQTRLVVGKYTAFNLPRYREAHNHCLNLKYKEIISFDLNDLSYAVRKYIRFPYVGRYGQEYIYIR